MGYCMQLFNANFMIPVENRPAAKIAVQKLAGDESKMSGSVWGGGRTISRHFGWVDMSFPTKASLVEVVRCWRWHLSEDENGNLVGIQFLGEKLGDDIVLWEALAPFVKPGSYIEMLGEDGERWRWVFDGKHVKEVSARITWP